MNPETRYYCRICFRREWILPGATKAVSVADAWKKTGNTKMGECRVCQVWRIALIEVEPKNALERMADV